ncbi:UNKNOWN [Stylonychia lemnae]|uniref:Uncharacterized protein n=1 Tax=Stylonychia lemnae TaxID=5949 RepID=A0A078AHS5_STYLE|nr:UNKNOWN [Stylonychia lemnae]|eukprot:CDW81431.1 UNKNOWN [Stylonychia lemnae]
MSKNQARRNLANIKTQNRYQSKEKTNLDSEIKLEQNQHSLIHHQSFTRDNINLKSFEKSPNNRNVFSQGGVGPSHQHGSDLNFSSPFQGTPSKGGLNRIGVALNNRLSSVNNISDQQRQISTAITSSNLNHFRAQRTNSNFIQESLLNSITSQQFSPKDLVKNSNQSFLTKRKEYDNKDLKYLFSDQKKPTYMILDKDENEINKMESINLFDDMKEHIIEKKQRIIQHSLELELRAKKKSAIHDRLGRSLNKTIDQQQKVEDIKKNVVSMTSPMNKSLERDESMSLVNLNETKSRISKLTLAQNYVHVKAEDVIFKNGLKSFGFKQDKAYEKNVKDLLNQTVKEYQIAKLQLSKLVNNGNFHQNLNSRGENHHQILQEIDQYCRLNTRGYFAPLNLMFTYETKGDLKVFLGLKTKEPTQQNNDGIYNNFAYQDIYLTFTSLLGVSFKVQAQFYDITAAQNKKGNRINDQQLDSFSHKKGFEMRIKYEVQRCLNDPAIYKDMIQQMTELQQSRKLKSAAHSKRSKNMIKLNKKTMGIWDEFQMQKNQHLAELKDEMKRRAQEKRELQEENERDSREQYMKRWDVFKEKRDAFYQRYVELKVKRNRVKTLLTHIHLQRMLKYLANYYNHTKVEAVMKAVRHFRCFKIQYYLKRFFRRKGTFEGRQQLLIKKQLNLLNIIYSSLNFLVVTQHENLEERAKWHLFHRFLDDTSTRYEFKEKMKSFREGIIYIQRSIKISKIMMKTKLDILIKMWMKELTDMQIKCLAIRDKKNREFVKDSQNIREDIRDAILNKYLEQCKHKNAMAYFQWRDTYSKKSDVSFINDLNTQQREELKMMFDCCWRKFLNISQDSPTTLSLSKHQSEISPRKNTGTSSPIRRYDEVFVDEPKGCIILKFEELNMRDPFAQFNNSSKSPSQPETTKNQGNTQNGKQSKFFPQGSKEQAQLLLKQQQSSQKRDKRVYEFERYVYPYCKMQYQFIPPSTIYLPDSELIRKMIKGCLKTKSPLEALAKF